MMNDAYQRLWHEKLHAEKELETAMIAQVRARAALRAAQQRIVQAQQRCRAAAQALHALTHPEALT